MVKGIISSTSPRAAVWRQIFGGDSVPLRSPIPQPGSAPGKPDGTLFYSVDVESLAPDQVARAVEYIATTFGEPPAQVLEGVLGEHGIPILADDVTVSLNGFALLAGESDDNDDGREDEDEADIGGEG